MTHLLFGPFYAATISMGPDGGLLVVSSRERMLAWGLVFCVVAATSLFLWLLRFHRQWCLAVFLLSLAIPAIIMPSVRKEVIYVRRDRITVDSGPWFSPSQQVIDLSNMLRIHQQAPEFKIGSLMLEPNAVWRLFRTDGSEQTLLLGQFFTAHRMVVAQYLRDRGRIVEPRL